ncbi:hypothetical protein D1Z97_03390 [Riemerella anatipestifer]|uniref:hypothetical protein n=1 Tax=Riemerella anatipestifer TaxID=34085 RepID=UPI00129E7F97|nr:hypothetical protein [Riemerella anatipestifer]MRN00248.1 hypothetical protein [Riemerella anatipestifer]MRN02132.1 hypothetical protein [Riemerella anatipestifer]
MAGSVKATGFIGANAAIFPDYVFPKYYTGTSSIKADYNFKTLSQVEDFVKTNGHLPGYQSAEAIKKTRLYRPYGNSTHQCGEDRRTLSTQHRARQGSKS